MAKNKKKTQKKVGDKLTDNVDEDKLSIVSEGYNEYAAFFVVGIPSITKYRLGQFCLLEGIRRF